MPLNKISHILFAFFSIVLLSFTRIDLSAQFVSRPDIKPSLIQNHLPLDNQNWEITQNRTNGFVYFANSAGLVEYNGISSRLFTMPFKQGLRSVYVDPTGTIFTGSFEDFGFWKSDERGGLEYHSLSGKVHIPGNDEIWNILALNGTVYFQSFTTIYAFRNGTVKSIASPGILLFMFPYEGNFLVQVLGQGLYKFDGAAFHFVKGSNLFAGPEILAIIHRRGPEYWICTAKDGIFSYNGTAFNPLNNEISVFLQQQNCNAGLAINDSLMVFGTILNGIAFCNSQGKITRTFNYSSGLNNNTVLSLFKDRNNGLWIGLDEGASYLDLSSPFTVFNDKSGTLGTIYSVIRKGELLYLGTNHGLFVADISKNNDEYSFGDFQLIPGSQGQVWKLYEYGDQILCGHNEGTFLVNGRTIVKISDVTGGWSFAGFNNLLLQGTYTGIISFTGGQNNSWKFNKRIQGFNEPTRYVEVDYLGYIWAIHPMKGIYRLELNEKADSVITILRFDTIGNAAGKIRISMINNQIVFMTGENIYSFDYENKKFYPLKSLAAGLGEYIQATHIIHYERNSYWFMLDNKFALFDISRSLEANKISEIYQKYIDLPGREQQIVSLDRNTLLVPTRQAFSMLKLSAVHQAGSNSAPVFTRLEFTGKNKKTVIIPGFTQNYSVSSKENNLTVYLGDSSGFEHAGKEYLYRISDLDETWHVTRSDNFTFLNLKYGEYHLQVKSSLGDRIAETIFTINRPWLISNVAIITYFLTLLLLILAGIKIFRIELNRHRRLIEYEVRKNKLESELDYKNYELMLTMRYLIRKTEILKELQKQIDAIKEESSKYPVKYVREMERIIREGLDSQTEEWKSAMNNLKLSQEGFFRKLKEKFPNLTPNDLRLCSYLRMNFTTKEMAHLLNISGRAIEIGRYRLRRKMNLERTINLTEFLINEAEPEVNQ
jgi:DNA-binding CsgD family transcriptional regulator